MKKIAFLAMGLCVSLMLWNCKGQPTGGNSEGEDSAQAQVENPLNLPAPQVQKFVRVVADESTEVFRYADVESPWRVTWTWFEDPESDVCDIVDSWSNEDVPDDYECEEYPAYAGDVFAVLGEEGDFYKVSVRSDRNEAEFGYVKKEDVAEVEPEKVDEDLFPEMRDMYGIHVRVIKEAKYKGLVLRVIEDDLEGNKFEVGVMTDDYLAFPEKGPLLTEESIDVDLLSDERIDEIVRNLKKQKQEYVKYDFVIPMTEGGFRTFWLKNK